MLKFIGRFMFFLLISCLVAGGLYWIVQRNPSALLTADAPRGFEERGSSGGEFQAPSVEQGSSDNELHQRGQRGGFRGGGEHSRDGLALGAGFLGILRNLGWIALITLVVVGIQKAFSLAFRRRHPRPA